MIYRVVLDTNVVISGFLFGGPPARVIAYALAGRIRCFTSLPILDEVREVLQRPKFGLSADQALTLIEELHDLCDIVAPRQRVRAVHADPDDNAVLECAMASDATMLVSGDSHLLELGQWKHVRILSPSMAVREIEGQQDASTATNQPRGRG